MLLIGAVAGGGSAGRGPRADSAPGGFPKFLGRDRLSRSRNLARTRGLKDIASMSSQTVRCSVTAGNVSLTVQSTTVKQSTIGFMSRLRSGNSWSGVDPEVVDLSGDEEVPESRRRYADLFISVWF